MRYDYLQNTRILNITPHMLCTNINYNSNLIYNNHNIVTIILNCNFNLKKKKISAFFSLLFQCMFPDLSKITLNTNIISDNNICAAFIYFVKKHNIKKITVNNTNNNLFTDALMISILKMNPGIILKTNSHNYDLITSLIKTSLKNNSSLIFTDFNMSEEIFDMLLDWKNKFPLKFINISCRDTNIISNYPIHKLEINDNLYCEKNLLILPEYYDVKTIVINPSNIDNGILFFHTYIENIKLFSFSITRVVIKLQENESLMKILKLVNVLSHVATINNICIESSTMGKYVLSTVFKIERPFQLKLKINNFNLCDVIANLLYCKIHTLDIQCDDTTNTNIIRSNYKSIKFFVENNPHICEIHGLNKYISPNIEKKLCCNRSGKHDNKSHKCQIM